MDSTSLGFEPGSSLAFEDLCTTDVVTSRLPKKLGHLVEVNQRGCNASYLYTVGETFNTFSSHQCALLDVFQGDEMTGCMGEALDPQRTWDSKAYICDQIWESGPYVAKNENWVKITALMSGFR